MSAENSSVCDKCFSIKGSYSCCNCKYTWLMKKTFHLMPQVFLLRHGQSPQVVAHYIWYVTVNLQIKFTKSESNSVTWSKIIPIWSKEGNSRCRVPKNWIRGAGFRQIGKHSWAVHFGKTGRAQFICLQWGRASNCTTGVVREGNLLPCPCITGWRMPLETGRV